MKRPRQADPYSRCAAAHTGGRRSVDPARLVYPNSYGDNKPGFLVRGYYRDEPFVCRDCGRAEVWTASQQKWWYEVARGGIFTQATRCRPCRRKEQARRQEARRVHLEGIAAKRT